MSLWNNEEIKLWILKLNRKLNKNLPAVTHHSTSGDSKPWKNLITQFDNCDPHNLASYLKYLTARLCNTAVR